MSRTLTAMFDHRVEAEAVRDGLVAASVAPDRIRIHADGAPPPVASHGLWTEMLGLLAPEEDRRVLHEGIRRGGALLTVQVDDGQADAAKRVIDAAHPVDLDVRKVEWRSPGAADGWDDDEED